MKTTVKYGDVFNFYCESARNRLKSYGEIIRLHNRYLTHLESRSLATITRRELQLLLEDIGTNHGHTAANRAIQQVSTIINYALYWEMYKGENPASKVKKFRLRSRDRFLKGHEIQAFMIAVNRCQSQNVKDFIHLCIYTGARSGSIRSMKWLDLDLHDCTWTIPDSKNGDPYTVPLIPPVIKILQARQIPNNKNVYVFPNCNGSYMRPPDKAWGLILRRAGIDNLRIHDLRRSLASWQAMTGASLPIIGKTLNHRDPRSTSVYARLDLTPVRQAIETAVDAMHSFR